MKVAYVCVKLQDIKGHKIKAMGPSPSEQSYLPFPQESLYFHSLEVNTMNIFVGISLQKV